MNTLITMIQKDLLEQWRSKKILIITIVMLFIAISSPIIAKLTPELLKTIDVPGLVIKLPEPTYHDSIDQFVKNISQIGLLVIVFVVSGAISDEKNRKTLEILLTKPVSRIAFVLSKFKSYFFSISAIFIASTVIFYLYTTYVFGNFNMVNFAILSGNILAYILMIVSITILASAIVKNSVAAGGIGFVSYILFGTIFEMIDSIKKYSPNTIFSNYKAVISGGWHSDLFWPLVTILAVIAVSVVGAVMIFKRQEVER
ncbi:MAG: ABC transporter permease [Thiobacillus sp.]